MTTGMIMGTRMGTRMGTGMDMGGMGGMGIITPPPTSGAPSPSGSS
jgi:hypothetical protein